MRGRVTGIIELFRPARRSCVALIGGLLASTFLSLVFVPAAFTIMDDVGRILSSKLSRLIGLKRRNEREGDAPA
jgi:hypothetical protein